MWRLNFRLPPSLSLSHSWCKIWVGCKKLGVSIPKIKFSARDFNEVGGGLELAGGLHTLIIYHVVFNS